MSKYIDADRLKELLSNKYKEFTEKSKNFCFMQYQFMADGLTIAEQMVDSLQQEQPKVQNGKFVFPKYLYARTVDNKTIDISYAPQSLDAVEYIKNDHIEQPEVDLDEKINRFWDSCIKHKNERGGNVIWSNKLEVEVLARYFYELGLKTRKED